MVGSSDGKMIVNSGKWPCGIVVCLTIPRERKGGSLQFFWGDLPFPQHAAGVVGTLNCCAFLYHSCILRTYVTYFWILMMSYYFYNVFNVIDGFY